MKVDNIQKASTSARLPNVASMNTKTSTDGKEQDLLIVGAGELGRLIANEWRKLNPGATIVGETRTDTHHDELTALGIRSALAGSTDPTPPFVVFCAPPTGGGDYVDAVSDAVARAATQDSRIVFTSSTSVYGSCLDIREDTPTVSVHDDNSAVSTPKLERARVLVSAENAVLSYKNGLVLRLTGMYTLLKGAHIYWLRTGVVNGSANDEMNVVHYKDAARAVVQSLRVGSEDVAKWPRRSCLVSARKPVSRKAVCELSLAHPLFKKYKLPEFVESNGSTVSFPSRTCNNDWTRTVLGWTPRWESFVEFMKDEVHSSASTS